MSIKHESSPTPICRLQRRPVRRLPAAIKRGRTGFALKGVVSAQAPNPWRPAPSEPFTLRLSGSSRICVAVAADEGSNCGPEDPKRAAATVSAFGRHSVKPHSGPPMTLGNAANARVRLIVWCKGCGYRAEPDIRRASAALRRRDHKTSAWPTPRLAPSP